MRDRFPDAEREKIVNEGVKSLWRSEGAEALTYLREKRGLTDDIIREFNFGYCPADTNHDLAGRILMPLYDTYGKLIAITTRHPTAPKQYQHWHEAFDKRAFLFGLNIAKNYMRKTNKAIIVEGQFDTGCLHSFGFRMTAGVLGSTFNVIHVTLLARFCREIFMVFDGDKSGDAGVARFQKSAEDYEVSSYGILCIPVFLPTGMDPDDFVRQHGTVAFVDLLRKSKEKFVNG